MVTPRARLAAALAAGLVLAGCAGGDEPPPEVATDVDTDTDTEAEPDQPGSTLERGGITGGDTSGGASPDAGDTDDGDGGGDQGGLTRGGGTEGSSLESGGVIEAPSLDRETLDLFADLEAGATSEGVVVEVDDDVLFDFDDDQLKPEADDILDDLTELAAGTGDVPIVVVGHTDGRGSDSYNLDLSQRRADAVIAGLVDRGVDESRLQAEGRGSSEPVAEEGGDDDEEARARNRRVEVTFEGVDLGDG